MLKTTVLVERRQDRVLICACFLRGAIKPYITVGVPTKANNGKTTTRKSRVTIDVGTEGHPILLLTTTDRVGTDTGPPWNMQDGMTHMEAHLGIATSARGDSKVKVYRDFMFSEEHRMIHYPLNCEELDFCLTTLTDSKDSHDHFIADWKAGKLPPCANCVALIKCGSAQLLFYQNQHWKSFSKMEKILDIQQQTSLLQRQPIDIDAFKTEMKNMENMWEQVNQDSDYNTIPQRAIYLNYNLQQQWMAAKRLNMEAQEFINKFLEACTQWKQFHLDELTAWVVQQVTEWISNGQLTEATLQNLEKTELVAPLSRFERRTNQSDGMSFEGSHPAGSPQSTEDRSDDRTNDWTEDMTAEDRTDDQTDEEDMHNEDRASSLSPTNDENVQVDVRPEESMHEEDQQASPSLPSLPSLGHLEELMDGPAFDNLMNDLDGIYRYSFSTSALNQELQS